MAEPGLNSWPDLLSEHSAALIGRDSTGYFWHLRRATQEVVWWAAALPALADVQGLHSPRGGPLGCSKGQLPHSLSEPIWGYHRVGYAHPCFTYIICLLVPLGPVTSLAAVR